jgi:hypothetical protein
MPAVLRALEKEASGYADAGVSRGVFIRPTNLILVIASAAAFGLVSFGQALVVIGGGFDLAVGSLVAMSISAIVFFRADFGIVGGTLGALAAATVAGLISGAFVSRTRLCVANEDSSVHRHAWHAVGRGLDVVDPCGESADHRARVQRRPLVAVRLLSAWREFFSDQSS